MWEESKVPSVVEVSEEDYHNLNHCSYSFLSKVDQLGYRAFKGGGKPGMAMKLGSFIDCYLLTPDELEDKFVATIKHPTGNKKLLADFIVENYDKRPEVENLYGITTELGLWSTRKKETVLKEFDSDYLEYLNTSIRNKGKIQYSNEDLELANICQNALIQSPLTEHIFYPEEHGVEVSFQTQGIFKMDDTHLKFMVDILVVDPEHKKIYIYDLKTGEEDLDSFEKRFLKRRYDIQHFIYTKGIQAIKEDLGYGNYEVVPLKFIYISKKDPEYPVIYEVPELNIYDGYTTKYGYQITGVKQLLEDFNVYNGGVKIPRRMLEGNGVITLDI